MTVLTLFEEQVRRHPDSLALMFGNEGRTYAELDSSANRLANLLEQRGFCRGSMVGLCFRRSFDQIASIIAVGKIGATYVPIDPSYPVERIRHIITDCGMEVLVKGEMEEISAPPGLFVISYKDDLNGAGNVHLSSRSGHPCMDDLAYILYTSGSTGLPKGVMITHQNLRWYIDTAADLFHYNAEDTWALTHSYGFDVSLWEIWGSLCCGGKLLIIPEAVLYDPPRMIQMIEQQRVSVLSITPAAFYAYLDADRAFGRNTVPTLRRVFIGGEHLDFTRMKSWFEKYGDEKPEIYNMYGPTETTIYVTTKRVMIPDTSPGRGSSIGIPLPGIRIILADERGIPVPEGQNGEILIGGEGVGKGYLNRPSLTAEKFIPDWEHPGQTLYRSGDLGRQLPGGEIEFLGRIDRQLKIRGHRVEPGEIEAVLRQHPSVLDAVVIPHKLAYDDIRLIGYVVPSLGCKIDESEIHGYLQLHLPPHMVCSQILSIPVMPLNLHGKVDRNALPMPDLGKRDLEGTYVSPRNDLEHLLAAAFSEVTGIPQVGIKDNFFRLGGNSLSVVRLVARIREHLGIWPDIRTVFLHPTVESLASVLDKEEGVEGVPAYRFRHLDRSGGMPLTYSQERVWLIQQRYPDTVAYNFEAAIRFYGELDPLILQECLKHIITRHEVYRTTFHFEEGRPVQRVHLDGVLGFEYTSLEHLNPSEGERFIEQWRLEKINKPFRLERLPLIHWHLFRLSPSDYLLLHREHHLLHDGWSFFLFMRELLELYRAALTKTPATLPQISYQIADFAHAQREWVELGGADTQRAFWRQQLEGCPDLLTLPWDFPRPAVSSMNGGSLRFEILPGFLEEVVEFAGRSGTTPFMVMVGVFALLMGRYSGMKDICVGSGVANRRHPETEGIIGMIINNLVFRFSLTPGISFRDFLSQVRNIVLDALSNQDLPFDQMITLPGRKSNESFPPICQVLFSSYDGPLYGNSVGALHVETELVLPINAAKFDLNVILIRQPARIAGGNIRDRMTMIWEYATDLFEFETIADLSRHYLVLLRNALQDPGRCIEEIPILELFEREEILAVSRGQETPYPREETLTSCFERQVQRVPDRVALVCGDSTWTYRTLNEWANKIAHRLQDAGVIHGSVVGCCLPRGPDAIAAILGILKAGGAYLPLNPKDPGDRIRYLVQDSAASALIFSRYLSSHLPDIDEVATIEIDSKGDSSVLKPSRSAGGSDLACIMYTSGSTGSPKGVEVLHRGILRLVIGVAYIDFGEEHRILQLAPLNFDASSFEIWGALLHGHTLVILPGEIPDPAVLEKEIMAHKITTMWLNASLFNQIIDIRPTALAPLRWLLIGGEPLSAAHVRRAQDLLPGVTLINGYGPTENTTFTCCYLIPRPLPESIKSIPLGSPIANTSVYVLDERMELVPFGVTGELYLGGDGVSRGYRGQNGFSSEVFLKDPFSDNPGATLYRSGDLGFLGRDGNLRFCGRVDRQIKVRGFRIEPAEIEAALCSLPHVRECLVETAGDPGYDQRLVAYLVLDQDQSLDPTTMRSSLRTILPAYMIPNYFIALDRLPLGKTGKKEKRGLPLPKIEDREWPIMAFCKYRNIHEVIVREIFEELLGTKDIGPNDDFFEKGGHSLQLLRLASRIYKVFGIPLDISQLFPSPSVFRVCQAITIAESRPSIQTQGQEEILPFVVPVKKHGSKSPVFLVPGGTGDDFSLAMYGRLAVFLPDDTPMYGFRTRDADERWLVPHTSVEEMATAFIVGIRKIQPHGPYRISGGCIGGVIAYEIARQLTESGELVEQLVLLEAWPPDMRGYLRMIKRNWCSRARFFMEDNLLRGDPIGIFGKNIKRMAPGMRNKVISHGPDIYRWIQTHLPWEWEDIPNEVRAEWRTFHKMVLRYTPQTYNGEVIIIESRDSFRKGASDAWRPFVRTLKTVYVPGNHLTYLTEKIREWGAQFGDIFK